MRGDVYELKSDRRATGHEQQGPRYAVIVQADHVPLTTVIATPTSTSCIPSETRPEIIVKGRRTWVLTDQMMALDLSRLGKTIGRVSPSEMELVDDALREVLNL